MTFQFQPDMLLVMEKANTALEQFSEKPHQVTPDNVGDLIRVRKEVNPEENKTDEQFDMEAEKFAKAVDQIAYLVYDDGTPAGYVLVHFNEDTLPEGSYALEGMADLAHLSKIGVIGSAQGKGLGKQLLVSAEECAQSQGKKGIWLDYLSNNDRAAGFYAGAGYKDEIEFQDPKKGKLRRIAVKRFAEGGGTVS